MQAEAFSTLATGTGSQSYTGLSFLPKVIIWLSGSIGTNPNTVSRLGVGFSVVTSKRGQATYSSTKVDRDINYEILVENPGRVFEGNVTSFDNPGAGVYGFTINQNTNTVNPVLYGLALA